mmetsp:Transcript_27755/g.61941  ORF Transcript_27755/g.61941 Transcript_27755/m.61941 type:complete len:469 (-) Transcript_27755:1212-2618(-)
MPLQCPANKESMPLINVTVNGTGKADDCSFGQTFAVLEEPPREKSMGGGSGGYDTESLIDETMLESSTGKHISPIVYEETMAQSQIKRRVLPGNEFESIGYPNKENAEMQSLVKWSLTAAVGILTGICAAFLDKIANSIVTLRNELIIGDFSFLGLLLFSIWNAVLVALSSSLALYAAPGAIGSGIPEIKGYLNGVDIKGFFTVPVFVVKFFGTIFSVSSGLMVGPEGPLVHLGSIIGFFITCKAQPSDPLPSCSSTLKKPFRRLHENNALRPFFCRDVNQTEVRDFVSIGAAAGFAVAFGAPVGGVLFALEEICSFWTPSLMWRALTATLLATLALLVFDTVLISERGGSPSNWTSIHPGLISLTSFDECSMTEIPIFVFIGVLGGLLGAAFIKLLNLKMTWLRASSLTRYQRVKFITAISILTSFIMFSIPGNSSNNLQKASQSWLFVTETYHCVTIRPVKSRFLF